MKKEEVLQKIAAQIRCRNLADNPELHLGPNWKTLMNFYTLFYSNKLRLIDGKRTVSTVSRELAYSGNKYIDVLEIETLKIISDEVKRKLFYPYPAWEIISMHRLLELGHTLKFCVLFGTVDTIESDTLDDGW